MQDRQDPDIGVWPNCRQGGRDGNEYYSANVRQKVRGDGSLKEVNAITACIPLSVMQMSSYFS